MNVLTVKKYDHGTLRLEVSDPNLVGLVMIRFVFDGVHVVARSERRAAPKDITTIDGAIRYAVGIVAQYEAKYNIGSS